MPEEKDAQSIAAVLRAFYSRVLFYPSRDFVFEKVSAYSREWEHERLAVEYAVFNDEYDVLVTVPDAIMQYTVPESVFREKTLDFKRGGVFSISDLALRLENMGYSRTEVVEGVGQYSIRGGIVDIFSPNYQYPVRIDFWDDEIDLIGLFDAVSQRRIENAESVSVIPCKEILSDEASEFAVKREINSLIKAFKGPENKRQQLLSELESLEHCDNNIFADKYFSLIYPVKQSLLDVIKDDLIFIYDLKRVEERAKGFAVANDGIIESLASSGLCRMKNATPYCSADSLFARFGENTIALEIFNQSGHSISAKALYNISCKQTLQMSENTDVFYDDLESYIAASRRILLLCSNEHAASAMLEMLADQEIAAYRYAGELYPSRVAITVEEDVNIKHGFELLNGGFVLLTDYIALR
ncbi:MAG: hypothetical protein IKZ05_00205, partial [Clostridia bacterium]|nr:hypothetical protein [Clostridia bacterium]